MNKIFNVGVLLLLSLFSCKTDNKDAVAPEADCVSTLPDTVSYATNVQPLFTQNCALSGCHSGSFPAGGLNLESGNSYTEITKKGSGYVDTLNPQFSVIISSMTSRTEPMPPTGNLSKCDIELIKKWMLQKAKNN